MSKLGLIDAYLQTDPGRIRDHNEDFVDCLEPTTVEDESKNGWLYIVADGVGGADAGEVASKYASEQVIEHYLAHNGESNWGQRLLNAMQEANTNLRQFVANRNDNSRMATTMVAAVIDDERVFIGNVGDSRGYHWCRDTLIQVTRDQSLVAKLLEEGAITEEEALKHPRKNVILYSLGSERLPKIDLFELFWQPGDMLVLCSDGLTKHVSDEEIGATVSRETPQAAANHLIQLANQRGGEDNISVIVIRYGTQAAARVASQAAARVTSQAPTTITLGSERLLLWLYTIVLSLVQSFLILLAWLLLRV